MSTKTKQLKYTHELQVITTLVLISPILFVSNLNQQLHFASINYARAAQSANQNHKDPLSQLFQPMNELTKAEQEKEQRRIRQEAKAQTQLEQNKNRQALEQQTKGQRQ